MARLGRDACAGLTGREWLDWLTKNDPAGFQWSTRGRSLLDMPYAPPGRAAGKELLTLIDAAYVWVTASDTENRPGRRWFAGRRTRSAPAVEGRAAAREGASA